MLHTRTIREAAAWFKSQDPQTCLTETAIRTLVRTGQVPCVRVGKKYLVTLEALEEYLSGGKLQMSLWRTPYVMSGEKRNDGESETSCYDHGWGADGQTTHSQA